MLRHYLSAALRHPARNRLLTVLNVAGLSLGFTAALLALLYVRHETRFDRFIPGHESLYVMVAHSTMRGQDTRIGEGTSTYLADWLRSDFPGLQAVRLLPARHVVRRGEIAAEEQTGWADPDFFAMLPLAPFAGDLANALRQPDSLAITRQMARKYFGVDSPLGQTLVIGEQSFQIAAVIADLPANTHLGPEIYGSALNRQFGLQRFDEVPWPVNGQAPVVTYVRLPDASAATLARVRAAMPEFVQRRMGRLFEVFKADYSIDMRLVPLADLHLYPGDTGTMKPHGRAAIVIAAGIAGLLILLAAVVNFVNLATAHAGRRAIEVGVRKVSGAKRLDLMAQFIGESLLSAGASMLLAAAVVEWVLPVVDARLVPGIAGQWPGVEVLVLAAGIALLTGVLGGVYPALVLSAFRPDAVLHSRARLAGSATGRHFLVALQFGILITLLVATLVIFRQTAWSLRDGLRFPQDQLLIVYTPCPTAFTTQLASLPGVAATACAGGDPTSFAPRSVTQATRADGTRVNLEIGSVGFGLFELLGVRPLAGRLYEPVRDAVAARDDRVPLAILNEAGARAMGFPSAAAAVGQGMVSIQNQGGPPSEVIGVVPDFTFDLQGTRMGPMVYWVGEPYGGRNAVVNVKLAGADIPGTLQAIDALWKRVGEPRPIRRLFLEQHLRERYTATIRQGYVVGILAALAVAIAVLGMFGLAALTVLQRTREIGIRKAMGAATPDILRMLLWQFMKPVLLANALAWPLAWFCMRRWLAGFANHIDLAPWMFLAASALAVAIALLTVIAHALLTSRMRPVTALRYE